MLRASASDLSAALRRVRAAGLPLVLTVGLLSLAGASRAEADNGGGPGSDGSLQLVPDVITNEGVSAGGSNDFRIRSELFLRVIDQRARDREASRAALTEAAGGVSFAGQLNPLFEQDHSEIRRGLFAEYRPQELPALTTSTAARGNDFWFVVMAIAALPMTALAVLLGSKTASRRRRGHGRPAH